MFDLRPIAIVLTASAAMAQETETSKVDPAALALPTLCMIPAQDRIVPPASAEALGRAIPDARTLRLAAGHIGMVVSARSERHVWRPLAGWLRSRSP